MESGDSKKQESSIDLPWGLTKAALNVRAFGGMETHLRLMSIWPTVESVLFNEVPGG